MSKGISIHIGVDYVDAKHYNHKYSLPTCVEDAKAMFKIAKDLGFDKSRLIINEGANSKSIIKEITEYKDKLVEDDLLLITFSGHGSRFGEMETWNLYDRMLMDKELKNLWSLFNTGVRILVISDSCHSGDIIRFYNTPYIIKGHNKGVNIYFEHKKFYDDILKEIRDNQIIAHVKLLASCTKYQQSIILNNRPYSAFTEGFLTIWNNKEHWKNGSFCGTYEWMCRMISDFLTKQLEEFGRNQTPTILNVPDLSPFSDNDMLFKI